MLLWLNGLPLRTSGTWGALAFQHPQDRRVMPNDFTVLNPQEALPPHVGACFWTGDSVQYQSSTASGVSSGQLLTSPHLSLHLHPSACLGWGWGRSEGQAFNRGLREGPPARRAGPAAARPSLAGRVRGEACCAFTVPGCAQTIWTGGNTPRSVTARTWVRCLCVRPREKPAI